MSDGGQSTGRTYRCPECGNEETLNPEIGPDEPACPCCWTGWGTDYPRMQLVQSATDRSEGGGDG